MSEELQFERTADERRYRALLGDKEAGFMDVEPVSSGGMRLKHTEVRPDYEGRGFAGQLVRHVLDDARHRGLWVVPLCSYVVSWIKRHPEYVDVVLESHRAKVTA